MAGVTGNGRVKPGCKSSQRSGNAQMFVSTGEEMDAGSGELLGWQDAINVALRYFQETFQGMLDCEGETGSDGYGISQEEGTQDDDESEELESYERSLYGTVCCRTNAICEESQQGEVMSVRMFNVPLQPPPVSSHRRPPHHHRPTSSTIDGPWKPAPEACPTPLGSSRALRARTQDADVPGLDLQEGEPIALGGFRCSACCVVVGKKSSGKYKEAEKEAEKGSCEMSCHVKMIRGALSRSEPRKSLSHTP
ncbi:hypothetical protein M409DRAFT_60291 [Zasmidium cellare ATCC 36951]|uniref:Uncharacterized protein n=1 Tax=Zasmidium cellare ATCC 36951 TaxID=1080233 RepID=A0A6A6C184_ZASCE|nr:uncharacterized protein M409DRAFT_60291 [Zasmidium cellare ATCC 36951]KAF2160028.1 hypothetical protein M409DRAFT_60291 [Zasmidium cellare ATCC 36951]